MGSPPRKRVAFLLGLTAFATTLLLVRNIPGDKSCKDFRQLYAAAYMMRTGQGSTIYDADAQRRTQRDVVSGSGCYIPFIRPAYEALLFAPLSLLPYRAAYVSLLCLNLVLLVVFVAVMSRGSPWDGALAAGIVLSFLPVSIALFAGQDSVLLTLILAASCVLLDRQRPLAAGAVAGLGLFKLQLTIPILLLFLAWRRWRFCAGFALSGLLIALISIPVAGVHQFASYMHLVQQVSSNKGLAVPLMPNLHGLLLGTMGWIPPAATVAADLAVACLLAIFLPRLRGAHALMLAIPAAAFCSHYLFNHDLTPVLLPIIAMMTMPESGVLARCSALFLLLAPTVLLTHSSFVAIPLGLFLLALAHTLSRCRQQLAVPVEVGSIESTIRACPAR